MSIKRIIAALSILSLCLSGCGQAVQVPNAELSGADPAVIKKFDKARESVNENPKSAAAWGHLGILFNAYGLMDQAIDCYQRAAELDPQEFRWSYLSAVLLAERDPEQAETELRRAAEINSQYAPLYCNLAMAFVKTGRDDEAQQEYETALRIDPKCRQALLGLGELKLQIGELEQSREYFMKAADLKFEDHQVHTLLARLYNRMRDQKSAEIEQNLARAYPQAAPPRDEIRALVQAEATGIGNLVDRGSALLKNGRFAEAETVFRRVIAQRKGTADDHEQLGRALAEQGQLKEAIKELETAMALDSKNANVVSTYGLLLARAGQTKQASDLLKQAVELDPSSDIARFYSGMTLQRLGEVEQALQAYRKVLELNPANAAGHLYLANLLAQQGDTDQAMVHWRLATEYNPKLHQAVFALVNAYNKQGQYANADELLSGKLKRKPNDVVILNAYAAHLAKCPDPQLRDGAKAIRTAEKIVAIRGIDDAGSLLFLAAVLAETGDFDRAIETLEDARKANLGGRNNPELARLIQSRQQQYRDRKPAGL